GPGPGHGPGYCSGHGPGQAPCSRRRPPPSGPDYPEVAIASLKSEYEDLKAEATQEPAATARPPKVSTGNRFALHVDSEAYPVLREMLRAASKSIAFETFSFWSDKTALDIAALMADRHDAGVKVRVLVDGYKVKDDSKVVAYLRGRGVPVRRYNPKVVYKLGFNITHRKIYAIDGVRAMTGGMNIGGGYECCTHDYLITVEGPAARDLTAEFESDWNASGTPEQVLDSQPSATPTADPLGGRATVVVTSRREADRAQEIRRAVSNLIAEATREISLGYPYFSDDRLIGELKGAIKRGVRVKLVLPAETDEKLMKILNPRSANQVWKAGGEVRFFDARFSHAKYFFVDGKKALLGSSNGDAITFKYNQEAGLVVEDPAFVAEAYNRLAAADWATSRAPRHDDLDLPWYKIPYGWLLEAFDFAF
ncbi:MAG: phosphatidylserine/phosphatidylglycerophosphate/cardiolipin synthase family protein, partial [Candidatus Sericytochromatia bacterium]|nr:phosphatidylserine/phosphatidylglycerophosphate/cardiolipin synthase family protein [Candidatus Tanganyikabacteria bacterium]